MKKLSYLFIALLTSMSIMTSCNKDDKDEATDTSAAAMEEMVNLDPTISDEGDNIVVTWAGKYYKATETFVFVDGVCSSAEYSGSLDCGSAVYAQLAYETLSIVPDGNTYGVQGSKITISRSETDIYQGDDKETVLFALQFAYGE